MFIESKNREEIMQYLFREGVIVAENRNQRKHPFLPVSNLEVIQLMRGFATRGIVKKQYAWRHYYYFLTEEGITFLREKLFIPADIMPATLKKTASSMQQGERRERREWRDGEDRPKRNFGRGGARSDAAPAAAAAPVAGDAANQAADDEAW